MCMHVNNCVLMNMRNVSADAIINPHRTKELGGICMKCTCYIIGGRVWFKVA